jgi:dephospho-CoA kinase
MIIGLTGKKGCGKSSVARIIAEEWDYGIKSFATPIKLMLSAMGLTDDELYNPEKKEEIIPKFGKSPRELMQLLGTVSKGYQYGFEH